MYDLLGVPRMTQEMGVRSRSVFTSDSAILIALVLVKLLLHFFTNATGGYGYFRDELYYLACAAHLDLGYVDQPPFSIYLLAVNRLLFGDSIFALRFLPALAGGGTVLLAGLMARELGGGRSAQVLAAVATLFSLINIAMDAVFSMNAFDHLFWALGAFLVIRLINTDDRRYWLILGFVLGLGLLNKTGVLWLGFGILLGLFVTPNRRWLKTRWPWIGGIIAIVVFLPYVVWNLTHGMAHLEFIRNATSGKYSGLSPGAFVIGQIILQNPFTLPLWVAGIFFFFSRFGHRFRVLGVMYGVTFLVLLLNQHSKPEYLAPAYAMLFAGGGIQFERWLSKKPRTFFKLAYGGLIALSGLALLPTAIPVLPVETYIRYAAALGINPATPEAKELDKLPQFYADMFGWEEKAAAVATVYNKVTPQEKARCAIFADNYGRCGAIDFFGPKYGLPGSIGKHNSYWIWGPREYTGELMIILGGALDDKREKFDQVEVAGVAGCDYCMPYEKDLTVYLCRGLKVPLKEVWPQMKSFD